MPKILLKTLKQKEFENTLQQLIQTIHAIELFDPSRDTLLEEYNVQLRNLSMQPEYAACTAQLKSTIQKMLMIIAEELSATGLNVEEQPPYVVQLPALTDILSIKGLPAGGTEDQSLRLFHMRELIAGFSEIKSISTEHILEIHWQKVFTAIDKGKTNDAIVALQNIPVDDIVYKALLSIHPTEYLQQIIEYSTAALKSGLYTVNEDIVITPKTFEVLIKDLATTLYSPSANTFSFGLPSHHALANEGSGFCIFNKTAILINHMTGVNQQSARAVIIGTDVNRDNGLCNILRHLNPSPNACHIDVFDSRVYPQQDLLFIRNEFNGKGYGLADQIIQWQHEQFDYFAVDLSLTVRQGTAIHPAIQFALDTLLKQIVNAKKHKQQVMLFFPFGWDSHQQETAHCGKYLGNRKMNKTEEKKSRFNDEDMIYFYQNILFLYQNNKDWIKGMYWGLEGGYNKKMYEQQIQLLIEHLILPLGADLDNSNTMRY